MKITLYTIGNEHTGVISKDLHPFKEPVEQYMRHHMLQREAGYCVWTLYLDIDSLDLMRIVGEAKE